MYGKKINMDFSDQDDQTAHICMDFSDDDNDQHQRYSNNQDLDFSDGDTPTDLLSNSFNECNRQSGSQISMNFSAEEGLFSDCSIAAVPSTSFLCANDFFSETSLADFSPNEGLNFFTCLPS